MSGYSMAELRDMAPAFVLGALTREEQQDFQAALEKSPELAAEVEAYRAVMERIGSAQETAPPPALRERFLERIASQRPVVTPIEAKAPPLLTVSRGGGRSPAAGWWTSGVLATALAASLLFTVNRNTQLDRLRGDMHVRDSLVDATKHKLGQRETTLNSILEAERELVVVHLAGKPDSTGIQFFWNVRQGRGVLHAFRLQPAPRGRSYQVWLVTNGKPVPSQVFNSDPDGHGLVWSITLPRDTEGVSAVEVTEEPAGGSLQPTTTPFLFGKVAP
jgi:anti-sigma-K factor RskA